MSRPHQQAVFDLLKAQVEHCPEAGWTVQEWCDKASITKQVIGGRDPVTETRAGMQRMRLENLAEPVPNDRTRWRPIPDHGAYQGRTR